MASLTMLLLHLLFVVSTASAWSSSKYQHYYRFNGGSLTFTPKYSNGRYEVEFRDRQTTTYCNRNPYTCLLGNCGTQKANTISKINLNSYGLNWCQQETLTKRTLGSNLPFEIRYPIYINSRYGQGFWVSNVRGTMAYWRMMAHVDLGIRSDTGESNRSPVIAMPPVIRVTRNCPRTFNLLAADPDGDHVKCRAATNRARYECSLCGLLKGFTLNQTSCSLTFKSYSNGYHPIELMVEDFPKSQISLSYSDRSYTYKHPLSVGKIKHQSSKVTRAPTTTAFNSTPPGVYRTTIPPLSKLPLQFSIWVDSYYAPSCVDGDYFPLFLAPTPVHGANLPAFVNHTLKITVRSRAQNTRIIKLIVSGPAGISFQKISTEDYIIKWTPTQKEMNGHFPICFFSEALGSYSRVYQSNVRCVVADVGHHDTVVRCNDTTMRVEVEKTLLTRLHEDDLHLNDVTSSSCNLSTLSNTTHLVAVMPLYACGTIVEEDDNNVIFKNKITSADPNQIISRQHDVDIAFSCAFPKKNTLTLGFRHKNPYSFSERGFGAFTFQFEFYESHRFRQKVNSSRYPVDVYLKQMMFMQIQSASSIPNTELFVESCKATPYDNPNSRLTYSIIENGCVKDSTVQIYPSSISQFRFGMEAFEFIGAYQEVYITCSVILCLANTTGTRCSQGCIGHENRRVRREAVDQTSRHFISQGPLHLVTLVPSDSKGPGLSLTLGLNIAFIVGCLLLCAVVIYRSRRSKPGGYKLLSTTEVD